MSSKVLLRKEDNPQIRSMIWRVSGPVGSEAAAASPSNRTVRFEPSVTIDPETATLRNRLVEAEHGARLAVEVARKQALAEGEMEGRRQAKEELQPVLARMAQALEEASRLRPKLREEAESDVVKLSLAIARRILHRELSVDANAIQALVQVALERLARQEIYRVRIHPAQVDALKAELAPHHSAVEIQADPRLEFGSLIFETNRGKMDASVAAQFEEIERGLTDRLKNA